MITITILLGLLCTAHATQCTSNTQTNNVELIVGSEVRLDLPPGCTTLEYVDDVFEETTILSLSPCATNNTLQYKLLGGRDGSRVNLSFTCPSGSFCDTFLISDDNQPSDSGPSAKLTSVTVLCPVLTVSSTNVDPTSSSTMFTTDTSGAAPTGGTTNSTSPGVGISPTSATASNAAGSNAGVIPTSVSGSDDGTSATSASGSDVGMIPTSATSTSDGTSPTSVTESDATGSDTGVGSTTMPITGSSVTITSATQAVSTSGSGNTTSSMGINPMTCSCPGFTGP